MVEYYLSILLAMMSMLFSVLLGAPIVVDDGEGSQAMAPASRDVRLPSGVRLRYLEQGPAAGPAILLLHGYTDSSFSFSRILPLLPLEWRVIVPDQRGHGHSDRPEVGYAVDDFATDALQLMDALQVESAVVVGHSMGSFIARRVAERAPARVTQLVLVGSGPTAATAPVVEVQEAVARLTDPPDPAFVREFQESMVVRPVPQAFMERAIAESESVPVRVWKAALDGLLDYTPSGEVRCPTLVLGGDADGVFSRAEQQALADAIPGARLEIVEGVGHSLQWEEPERFVDALRRLTDGS